MNKGNHARGQKSAAGKKRIKAKPITTPDAGNALTQAPVKRKLASHEIMLAPEMQAAARMESWGKWAGQPDVSETAIALIEDAKKVNTGDLGTLERMLYAQAVSLDTMFTSLARRAHGQEFLPQFQAFTNLALRAQSQCRSTIEALAEIKNPKPVAFVKQANIAHQQQVNNGDAAPPAKALTPPPAQLAAPDPILAGTWTQAPEANPASRVREESKPGKTD